MLATSRSPLDISVRAHLSPGDARRRLGDCGSSPIARRPPIPRSRVERSARRSKQICTSLDGIALAIELAAARVRTMSVESLASHLELRLLAGGRDRRPRQQTMRAFIDWSYDLLDEDERRVFAAARSFSAALRSRSPARCAARK